MKKLKKKKKFKSDPDLHLDAEKIIPHVLMILKTIHADVCTLQVHLFAMFW